MHIHMYYVLYVHIHMVHTINVVKLQKWSESMTSKLMDQINENLMEDD